MTSGMTPADRGQVEVEHGVDPEPTRAALVGDRRVDVPVADDDGAARERRPDHLLDVLGARRGVQRRLGPRRDVAGVQDQVAHGLAERRPPGSRVSTTSLPAAGSRAASRRACVDFPEPSIPSNVTNIAD